MDREADSLKRAERGDNPRLVPTERKLTARGPKTRIYHPYNNLLPYTYDPSPRSTAPSSSTTIQGNLCSVGRPHIVEKRGLSLL